VQFAVTSDSQTDAATVTEPIIGSAVTTNWTLSYFLPEQAQNNTLLLSITRISGPADAGSPHVAGFSESCNCLTAGAHVLRPSEWSALVDQAVYSISVTYQDLLNNPAVTATVANFIYGAMHNVAR